MCTRIFARLGALLVLVGMSGRGSAAHWDGGLSHANFTFNNDWSTANNWSDGLPTSGPTTDITFGLSSLWTTANQNLASPFTLRNLTFIAGSNVTALTGNALSVASGGSIVQDSVTNVSIGLPIAFGGAGTIQGSGLGRLTFSRTLSSIGTSLTLRGSDTHPTRLLVTLAAANTFSTLQLGMADPGFMPVDVTLGHDSAAGLAGILMYNGNTLRAAGARTLANPLALSVALNGLPLRNFTFGTGGDLSFGPVSTAAAPKTLQIENTLTVFAGGLTGSAALTKAGPGTLALSAANGGFLGSWIVDAGLLDLRHPAAALGVPVTVNVDGGLGLANVVDPAIGALSGGGAIALRADSTLTIAGTSLPTVYSGAFSSPAPEAGAIKIVGGQYQLSLSGISAFGRLEVETGNLILAGARLTLGTAVKVGPASGNIPAGLTLQSGAQLTLSADKTFLLVGPTGTTVTVIGAGSKLKAGLQLVATGAGSTGIAGVFVEQGGLLEATYVVIGAASDSGRGEMTITSGGKVDCFGGIIGIESGSPGSIYVTDPGSTWQMSSLGLGGFDQDLRGGVGNLLIANRGSVVVSGNTTFWAPNCRIEVNSGGTLTTGGLFNLAGGSSMALSDPDEATLALTVGSDSAPPLNYSGTIGNSTSAPGGLRKVGASSLSLSGALSYTGPTRVEGGLLQVPNTNVFASRLDVGSGATFQFAGVWGTNAVSQTFIAPGGRLSPSGTATLRGAVHNAGLIEVSGSSSLTLGGAVENTGRIRVSNGATLTVNQSLANSGVLDLITAGGFVPPPGFVNAGTILDRHSLRPTIAPLGAGFMITAQAFAGHTYRLQRSTSLSDAGFLDLGLPQSVSSEGTCTFVDPAPPSGQAFYRIRVD